MSLNSRLQSNKEKKKKGVAPWTRSGVPLSSVLVISCLRVEG